MNKPFPERNEDIIALIALIVLDAPR